VKQPLPGTETEPSTPAEPVEAADGEPGGELPVFEIPESDIRNELSVLAALIAVGLARHHPDARRRFREEGIAVNGEPVSSDKAKLRLSDVTADGVIRLSLGEKRHVLLKPV
jgi:tyrosyl-tRNA synthetase